MKRTFPAMIGVFLVFSMVSGLFGSTRIAERGRCATSAGAGRMQEAGWMQDMIWHKAAITGDSVAFSPDGRLIAATMGFGEIGLFRVSDGDLVRTLKGHTGWVRSVSFSPDGSMIASGSEDGTINLWRVSDGALIRTLKGHTLPVHSVSFSPDGSMTASGSEDGLALWRVGPTTPER